MLVEG